MTTSVYSRPDIDLPDIPYDQLLRNAAHRGPDHTAIIFNDEVLTYGELVAQVDQVAHGLRQLSVEKGQHVSLFTLNCPEYVVTQFAISTIGAVIVPISPAHQEHDLAYRLLDSESSAILVHQELVPVLVRVLAQREFPTLKHVIVIGETLPAELPNALLFSQLLHTPLLRRSLLVLNARSTISMPSSTPLGPLASLRGHGQPSQPGCISNNLSSGYRHQRDGYSAHFCSPHSRLRYWSQRCLPGCWGDAGAHEEL